MDQPISLETVISSLGGIPLFSDLDQAELSEIVRIMLVLRFQDGEVVFREGDPGDAWYVIFEGHAEVWKAMPSGPPRRLSVLDMGDCFGEIAILDGSARSASVSASGPLTVFRFRRVAFDELLDQGSLAAHKLVGAMARQLARRHRSITHQLTELMDQAEPTVEVVRAELGGLVDRFTVSE